MMTPTSEERREVAKRLRVVDAKRIEEPDDMVQALAVCVTPETSPEFVDFPQTLFSRLADLIDPTCHVVTEQPDCDVDEFVAQMLGEVCSSCGHDLHRDRFTGRYPAHCPGCGARVVEGGDAR